MAGDAAAIDRTPAIDLRVAAAAALAVVAVVAGAALVRRTLAVEVAPQHFSLLAGALLQGHLYLDQPVYDGVIHGGRTYLPFGPWPAILLAPAVLIWGTGVPVVWLGLAAVAVAVLASWRTWPLVGITSSADRAWLTVAMFAGTAVYAAAVVNSGYFVAHLVVIACLSWALLAGLQGRLPWVCGALVALAALTRTTALVASLPLAALYWERTRSRRDVAAVLIPLLPALFLLAAYNDLRFGNPLDSGYAAQSLANPQLVALRAQGLFSLRHLPVNLYYLLVAPPAAIGAGLGFPWFRPDPWGMGLVFVSPWVLLAAFARGRAAAILAAGFLLVVLPGLLYYGVGWIQFGYRYGLDALPFLAALAACGAARHGRRLLPYLVTASVVVNLAGAAWLVGFLGA